MRTPSALTEDATSELISLFSRLPGFMALTRGAHHKFVMVNSEFCVLAGKDPTGMTVAEALPELEAQGIVRMLDQVLASGQPFRGRDMRIRLCRVGQWEEHVVDFTSQPVMRRDGSFDDILCFGHDVTERVHASREAARLQQELKAAANAMAMNAMASTLAHEVNQPLLAATSYMAAARRAQRSSDPDIKSRAWDLVAEAEKQVHRAGEIIRRTRGALLKARPKKELVPLQLMITEALTVLEASGSLEDVSVSIELESPTLAVFADKMQIEQVFVNALRNAAQAMRSCEQRQIIIRASTVGEATRIEVIDSGPGLQRGVSAFDAFRSSTGGMGIGLSISRTIVEAHGGSINLESLNGRGAKLTVVLPPADTSRPKELHLSATRELLSSKDGETHEGQVG